MGNFTFEETNLLCIYNTGSRTGLTEALTEMRGELSPEEAELRWKDPSIIWVFVAGESIQNLSIWNIPMHGEVLQLRIF